MAYFSRVVLACIAGMALSAAGCSKRATPANASGNDSKPSEGNAQARSDLGFLHHAFTEPVFGKTPERLPQNLSAAATAIKLIDERIYERVKGGVYVVRWGVPLGAPVLAYEKGAPAQGGWVLRGGGAVEKMSAEQLNNLLGYQ